jgi:hypothetical protein
MKGQKFQSRIILPIFLAVCSFSLFSGCTNQISQKATACKTMIAQYTNKPIKIDGILDEPIWKSAITYNLSLGRDQQTKGHELVQPGEAQLAWDDTHFYVAIKFHDSDIVAKGEKDEMHHYKLGDLVELFLKPEKQPWYWELYATPRSKKTSFWLPQRGTLTLKKSGLRVASQCKGTLNNSEDKDSYWTAEMAMPIADLATPKQSFQPGSKWRILIARYNYNRYLPAKELSMTPQLSKTMYHLYEEYAFLKLAKK